MNEKHKINYNILVKINKQTNKQINKMFLPNKIRSPNLQNILLQLFPMFDLTKYLLFKAEKGKIASLK